MSRASLRSVATGDNAGVGVESPATPRPPAAPPRPGSAPPVAPNPAEGPGHACGRPGGQSWRLQDPRRRAARHGDTGPRLPAAPGRPVPRACEGPGRSRARVAGLREQRREVGAAGRGRAWERRGVAGPAEARAAWAPAPGPGPRVLLRSRGRSVRSAGHRAGSLGQLAGILGLFRLLLCQRE